MFINQVNATINYIEYNTQFSKSTPIWIVFGSINHNQNVIEKMYLELPKIERNTHFGLDDILKNRMYIFSRHLLYTELSKLLSIPIDEIVIEKNKNGKPFISNSNIHFSLSHTVNDCALIFSHSPVGIDLEGSKSSKKHLNIAKRFFCETEYNHLKHLDESKLNESFLNIWTTKEALVKCFGDTMFNSMKNIDTINNTWMKNHFEIEHVYCASLNLPNDFLLSFCSTNHFETVELKKIEIADIGSH